MCVCVHEHAKYMVQLLHQLCSVISANATPQGSETGREGPNTQTSSSPHGAQNPRSPPQGQPRIHSEDGRGSPPATQARVEHRTQPTRNGTSRSEGSQTQTRPQPTKYSHSHRQIRERKKTHTRTAHTTTHGPLEAPSPPSAMSCSTAGTPGASSTTDAEPADQSLLLTTSHPRQRPGNRGVGKPSPRPPGSSMLSV